jgi:MSHA biogenesis protein MshO
MDMRRTHRGFTLIELVMVIVILGVIGGMVSVFMKRPIDAYFDTARRAALADVADTTLRRMARDIHKALPNSIQVPNNQCVEFIPTKTGGRYRVEDKSGAPGTGLDFSAADTGFNMLGSNSARPADQQIADGDLIAVYNLGIAGSNAYNGDNTAAVSGTPSESGSPAETTITIASKQFPLPSGSNRFHVIPGTEKVVSYICSGGTLYRNANYAYSSSCPAPTPGTTPVIATNLDTCNFVYNGSDLQRNGLVQMTISFTNSGETVTQYHEIHVNNTP